MWLIITEVLFLIWPKLKIGLENKGTGQGQYATNLERTPTWSFRNYKESLITSTLLAHRHPTTGTCHREVNSMGWCFHQKLKTHAHDTRNQHSAQCSIHHSKCLKGEYSSVLLTNGAATCRASLASQTPLPIDSTT